MNNVELYREIDVFYQIRGDEYAKNYILKFVNKMITEKVKISDFRKWLKKNKLNFDFEDYDEAKYNKVLDQFVRYINAVNKTKTKKVEKPKQKHSKTKIHNTFHDLQKTTPYKL